MDRREIQRGMGWRSAAWVAAMVLAAGTVMAGEAALKGQAAPATEKVSERSGTDVSVRYKTVEVDGLEIFYREAGDADKPVILLLHGFPTSSHMFRNLIPQLASEYRVIAPDYPGFGNSAMPGVSEFTYTFDNLAKVVDGFTRAVGAEKFTMYVQDYGAPIGYRIASAQPQRVQGIIVQNGNAYEEGLQQFWDPFRAFWKEQTKENRAKLAGFLVMDVTKWQWTHGVGDVSKVSPDNWVIDQALLDRPGNKEIQLQLFLSYGSNPPLYPSWQKYFREHQPPMLIVWGKNDHIFPASGAEPYKRDVKNLDFNLLDTGHFALEEMGDVIADKIKVFMRERVKPAASGTQDGGTAGTK